MTNQDKHKTKVIFRMMKWRTWGKRLGEYTPGYTYHSEVIALFPGMDEGRGLVASYAHIGQHSSADYLHCIKVSRPATKEEYGPLQAELTRIGYNLEIMKRRNG